MLVLLLGMGEASYADARLLIVSGIGGEESYSRQFRDWALQMRDVAIGQMAMAPQDVRWLCESPQRDPAHCAGESRREAVLAAIAQMLDDAPATRSLMVLLIGHGTTRDGRALFNIAGPDLSARDLDEVLAPEPASELSPDPALSSAALSGRQIAVVNTAPASAGFIPVLAKRGRIIVTATARSAENDHTRFAAHFIAAFADGSADADRDARVSLLEAFRFAVKEVAREYATKRQVSTEHALLEDNADGQGSRTPLVHVQEDPVQSATANNTAFRGGATNSDDGAAAAVFFLASAIRRGETSAARMALESEARELVARVHALRRRKVALATGEYEQLLETLLVELALNRQAVREGGS